MKIKIDEKNVKEFPDNIAALMIADPSYGREIPDLSANEVNTLIHGILASIYDPSLNFEENLRNIEHRYSTISKPSSEAMSFALNLVDKYKDEIKESEIGMVSFDDMYQDSQDHHLPLHNK